MADAGADSSVGIVLPDGGRLAFKSVHDPDIGRWGALGCPAAGSRASETASLQSRGRPILTQWRDPDRKLLAKTDGKNGSYIFAIARIDPTLRPSAETTNPALVSERWSYGVRLLEAWRVPRLEYKPIAEGRLSACTRSLQGAPFWLTEDIGGAELAEWLAGMCAPIPITIWQAAEV